ncbi:methionine--tRNA ligase [bacterium]|nr:methionine--tRNA ligase [bacterium]
MAAAQKRQILVTTALPYANGPIHMGHMLEHVQADIWVRFQRMTGNECYFFCADDTHGTPIFVRAKNEGRKPEDLIAEVYKQHKKTFQDFQISFDHYSSTHSDTNRQISEEFYIAMRDQKHTAIKQIKQTYCPNDKMFLPDRLVKGTCPKCSALNQYGDSCDVCGSTYSPTELKQSACSLCGTAPILKESDHIFFKLNHFRQFLKDWVADRTSIEVSKKLDEWLKEDLRDWDISRDEPYFGFKIPGYNDKYFYVWVDAPIGYMATSKDFLGAEKFNSFWKTETTELHHFIGKDIIYFHALFWPAMLKTAGYRTPTRVHAHGFLTVNGEKMSKSKGTFVNADTYSKHLDASYLRYYYASKLTDGIDDLDLNLEDFVLRVNSDLVGKYVNLGSRSAQMLIKNFAGQLPKLPSSNPELQKISELEKPLRELFEKKEFSKAINLIREGVDSINQYFDKISPWKLLKEDPQNAAALECLGVTLNAFRILSIYLTPVIPAITQKVAELFGETPFQWQINFVQNKKLNAFSHLIQRVEAEKVQAMIEDSKTSMPKPATAVTAAPESSLIEIEDFNKIDLRIAKVIHAQEVEGTDKMLQLKVSVGTEEKNIFAGIKKSYKPEQLIGKQVLIVANLKPRKMKFGISEGMVLCASEGEQLFVLSPDGPATIGSKVK